MRFVALIFALLLCSGPGVAETIQYEIYEVTGTGRHFLAKGTRTYSLADVRVFPYEAENLKFAEKFVELEKGFRIGARILEEKELGGFGLLAGRSDRDFSWEWYSREFGNRYRKLQGGTLVTIAIYGAPFFEELAEVRFSDDTTLRFKSEVKGRDDTHHIVIKAGSVLRFR